MSSGVSKLQLKLCSGSNAHYPLRQAVAGVFHNGDPGDGCLVGSSVDHDVDDK